MHFLILKLHASVYCMYEVAICVHRMPCYIIHLHVLGSHALVLVHRIQQEARERRRRKNEQFKGQKVKNRYRMALEDHTMMCDIRT